MQDKNKVEIMKDVIAAYTHCNNMPLDISKKRWLDHIRGITEEDQIINFLNVQMKLLKRIIDNVIGEDCKLPANSTIFRVEQSELEKEFLKKV